MTDTLLGQFGQILMSEVRDPAIEKYEMIVEGKMKSARALKLSEGLSSLTHDQLALVREVVLSSIDDVLHNFLWTLEQHERDLELNFSDESDRANLSYVSDGLAGELYSEDGWIAQHSKYKGDYQLDD